jgi:hypothetical protein
MLFQRASWFFRSSEFSIASPKIRGNKPYSLRGALASPSAGWLVEREEGGNSPPVGGVKGDRERGLNSLWERKGVQGEGEGVDNGKTGAQNWETNKEVAQQPWHLLR